MLLRELGKAWRLMLGLPKTLIFNFRYLPFAQACRLPVLVSHRVKFVRLGGTVELTQPRFGAVRLGLPDVDVFPDAATCGIWKVSGRVRLGEDVRMGPGIRVVCEGEVNIGDHVYINSNVSFFCAQRIVVGSDVLISWNSTLVDHDFHALHDADGKWLNPPADIAVGNKAWLGLGVIVTKGTTLARGTVVGAGAVVRGAFDEPGCILTGNPASVVRRGVLRDAATDGGLGQGTAGI